MMDTEAVRTAAAETGKSEASLTDIALSNIEISDIVVSVNGRDKGKSFFVVYREDIYVMLCDGKSRRVEKPKRKKLKHIRFVASCDCRTSLKLRSGFKVTNSEIRKALAEYQLINRGEKEVCK